eukprot:6171515-Amphidinium_carterae.1
MARTKEEKTKVARTNLGKDMTKDKKEKDMESHGAKEKRAKATKVTTTTTTTTGNRKVTTIGKERTKEMEENRKDHHYLQTTATTGKERTEEKEKETRTSFDTAVENQVTRATNVGGNRKDNYSYYTTSTNHHQCGQYPTTTQHRIYNLLLRQRRRS